MCDFETNLRSFSFYSIYKINLTAPSWSAIIELSSVEFQLLLAFRKYPFRKFLLVGKMYKFCEEKGMDTELEFSTLCPLLLGLILLLLSRI